MAAIAKLCFANFDIEQDGKTLRWVRALLGPVLAPNGSFVLLSAWRLAALVGMVVAILWDATNYDLSKAVFRDADRSPWLIYGMNDAELLCLAYCGFAIWLTNSPERSYETDQEGQTMPWAAKATWVLHTLALPAMYTSFIIYEEVLRHAGGFRTEQHGSYIFFFIMMSVNFLAGNTPLLLSHVGWSAALVSAYLVLMFIYQVATGNIVYPQLNGPGSALAVVLTHSAVHVGLAGVDALKNRAQAKWAKGMVIWA
jgi:hypothetical protein